MNPTTTRPKDSDPAILEAVAKQLAPEVKRWLGPDDDTDLDSIEDDLIEAIRYKDDGYELARELDGIYSPDAELVSILDGVSTIKYVALKKAEQEWLSANNIQPHPVGARVKWTRRPELGTGIIASNLPEGKSTVSFESLSHKEGCGFIVAWEQLEIQP